MKKIIVFAVSFLALTSCNQLITDKDISKINGYWEIEKVILSDGAKKEYKVNETIDFFQIKNNIGFRKKVTPQLDGTYLVNNQKEKVLISIKDKIYFLNYSTNYTKFKEQIIKIQDSILILKNDQNVEYHYKKPIPFSIK